MHLAMNTVGGLTRNYTRSKAPVLTKGLCTARNLNTEVIQPRNATADNECCRGSQVRKTNDVIQ